MATRDPAPSMVRAPRRQSRYAGWTNLVLGLLIFATPLVLGSEHAWHHWSNYTAGILIAFLALLTVASPHQRTQGALAGGILELAIGVWVVATAFVAPANGAYFIANLVLGLAVVVVALWSLSVGALVAHQQR